MIEMTHTSFFTDKKVLVTGGAGFIGSNLIDELVNIGCKNIVVLDNLETGDIKNIQEHIKANKIEFLQGDIRNMEDCLRATKNCDVVFHQAALGSVPRSIEKPLETHATNVTGFVNMLQASKMNSASRFVYASSSSVYGDDKNLPKKEALVGNPLSPYAVSKKSNELYAAVFANLYNIQVIGLRYFNVFGPKQNPSGPYAAVIPIFINKLLEGERCTIYGDGNNKRDFTYISNVVQANLLAASTKNSEAINQIYNIAFGNTKTINELFENISSKLRSTISPEFKASRPGEIKDSFADISNAKNNLGYSPSVGLDEGITHTIEWYQENRR